MRYVQPVVLPVKPHCRLKSDQLKDFRESYTLKYYTPAAVRQSQGYSAEILKCLPSMDLLKCIIIEVCLLHLIFEFILSHCKVQ